MDNARCPFEKAILSVQCDCEMATRFSIAEQMGVECRSDIARNNCTTLLVYLRERARFVLKVTDTSAGLPFGKEMKVMLGGLIGLQRQMAPQEGSCPGAEYPRPGAAGAGGLRLAGRAAVSGNRQNDCSVPGQAPRQRPPLALILA